MYHLLPDQILPPLPSMNRPVLTFNDAEDMIQDAELSEPSDEALDRELRLQQRRNAREIRQLENEVGRWNVLVDSVTGVCPGELDGQTLAVLRGRMVRYLMRSREITIGRMAKGHVVDIDLSLEGPAHKISRRQGTLRYVYEQHTHGIYSNDYFLLVSDCVIQENFICLLRVNDQFS